MSEREKASAAAAVAPDDDDPAQLPEAPSEVGPGRPPREHQFKPGNPGRPKGARNKLGEAFLAALYADFKEHGKGVIEEVRKKEPGTYLRVIARVVPQHLLLHHEDPVSALSDEELTEYLLAVREAIAARDGGVAH